MICKNHRTRKKLLLSCAIATSLGAMLPQGAAFASDINVTVETDFAKEEAKLESQQKQVISAKDIEEKQAKSAEDIVFNETGVTRTVDAMGRVGVSIRGAEPRHTLILVDGQPVVGEFAKYQGDGDELMRLGTENVERIEITQGTASAKYGSGAMGGVINVITRKPLDTPQLQFNAESLRMKGDSGLMPYSNFYLRADTGKIGKAKFAIYGSKRDIMPVYGVNALKKTGIALDEKELMNFHKNSLRFFGQSSNLGISSTVELDSNSTLNLRMDKYTDELQRFVKHSDSIMEPQINYRRNITRDNYSVGFDKNGNKSNLKIEANYAKLNEKDLTLSSYEGKSIFEGNNILNYIDTIDHRQYDIHADVMNASNDRHTIKYGFGVKKETGKGSRLKSAPKTKTITINPWDYDKNLFIDMKRGKLGSTVHDYKLDRKENGVPYWNPANEWYGYDESDKNTSMPDLSYEEFNSAANGTHLGLFDIERALVAAGGQEMYDRALAFGRKLAEQNPDQYNQLPYDDKTRAMSLMIGYYSKDSRNIKFNGKAFKDNFAAQNNQVTIGEASINKHHFYIQDDWQMDDNTVLTPSIRLDHSNLFGSNLTFNLGATHNIKGNENRRLKANIGTGYAEPGLGELYYNWEMFGPSPMRGGMAGGTSRLGWYWVGNPNLKPEKSFNMDLSYEADSNKSSFRATLFKNKIKNYLTAYFTGEFMDFAPEYNDTNTMIGAAKWLHAPDMIYSFKNIGNAEITGLTAEYKQKLSSKWSSRLGYTFLHAINKSDKNMPRHLLNKPTHKVDIGLDYRDEKTGWFGTLYGSYYIKMLDSNEISGGGNTITSYLADNGEQSVIEKPVYNKVNYKEKTYGTWNLMIQRKLKDGTVGYFGIDNLFNHRDDYKALQGRVFRFGVNFKFGTDGKMHKFMKNEQGQEIDLGPVELRDFLITPFDEMNSDKVHYFGEYQARWNVHGGINRPLVRVNEVGSIGDTSKNMVDPSEHGFEQKVYFGLEGAVDNNARFKLMASASGSHEDSTKQDVSNTKALNKVKLETADITNKAGKWNYSFGRLQEKIGVSGTYFNNSFDGARAVYTNNKTQVRLGVGSFARSTGITDSPYTKIQYATFPSAPTVLQFLGIDRSSALNPVITEPDKNKTIGFYKQFIDNDGNPEAQLEIMNRMVNIINKAYPDYLQNKNITLETPTVKYHATYEDFSSRDGSINGLWGANNFSTKMQPKLTTNITDPRLLATGKDNFAHTVSKDFLYDASETAAYNVAEMYGYVDDFELLDSKDKIYSDFLAINNPLNTPVKFATKTNGGEYTTPRIVFNMWDQLSSDYSGLISTENFSKLPREALALAGAARIERSGIILNKDNIPAMNRGAYLQVSHALNKRLGLQAWYLRSIKSDDFQYNSVRFDDTTNSYLNDKKTFNEIANVFGIGAKYQVGYHSNFTVEYGVNTSAYAKYINGNTVYSYNPNNYRYNILEHKAGKAPRFFNIGFNIGYADANMPKSWEAFAAYRRYEHGAFLGGNGTGILPDRYLDGVASYSIGGAYVPAKNLMVKMAYTFGAKGLKDRDTIYGPESFKLGNYSRIEMIYKF